MTRNRALALGLTATLAATLLWHGAGGAGERLAASLDRQERAMLDHYEMQAIGASTQHHPLARTILLSGRADDFQRFEMVRMSEELPGISTARWVGAQTSVHQLPLLAEVMLMALACFAAGAVLAYIAALRRRAREAVLE